MLTTTIEIVKASLKADGTVTAEERARILCALRSPRSPAKQTDRVERIVRRSEAAERFGVALRTIDHWAKTGLLSRVQLPGHVRACGFRECDILELMTPPVGNGGAA